MSKVAGILLASKDSELPAHWKDTTCGARPPTVVWNQRTREVGGIMESGRMPDTVRVLVLAWNTKPLLVGCFYAEPGGGHIRLFDVIETLLEDAPMTAARRRMWEKLRAWAKVKGCTVVVVDEGGKEITA